MGGLKQGRLVVRSADSGLTELLHWLAVSQVRSPQAESSGFMQWWESRREERRAWRLPFDQAAAGGYLADCVGYAFAAGYEAAVCALVPAIARGDRLLSLSVTEEGGGHPRAINTTLAPGERRRGRRVWRLSGRKKWATLALQADLFLIAASTGSGEDGRKRIRLVGVERQAPGVSVRAMPATPFTPEISHGEIELRDVAVYARQVLPGDGFADYVKPFRTMEDTHVNAAVLGYLLRAATQYGWPLEVREELLSLMAGLRAIATCSPSAPEVHIALAGFFLMQQRILEAIEPLWAQADTEVRARWQRDAHLLGVAGGVRARRREVAWKRVSGS